MNDQQPIPTPISDIARKVALREVNAFACEERIENGKHVQLAINEATQSLQSERDKLRKALEEEVGRIEYGNSTKPDFYESNSHFGYCSKQSGDPRDCSVCGTFYLMKDALNHSKSTTQ